MKTKMIVLIKIGLLFVAPVSFGQIPNPPKALSASLPQNRVNGLALHPLYPNQMGTYWENKLYMSDDVGKSWREAFRIPDLDESIQFIQFLPSRESVLFIGTTGGLFRINTTGQTNTEVIFSSSAERENHCVAFAINPFEPKNFYLATKGGYFVTQNQGKDWEKLHLPDGSKEVHDVAFHPNIPSKLFLLTENGLYKAHLPQISYQKLLSEKIYPPAEGESPALAETELPEKAQTFRRNHLFFSLNQDDHIYLNHPNGLFLSKDGGENWQKFLPLDLASSIETLVLDSHHEKLFFLRDGRIWQFNPSNNELLSLLTTPSDEGESHLLLIPHPKQQLVYTVGTNFFSMELPGEVTVNESFYFPSEIQSLQDDLPSIRELQASALEYAHLTTRRMRSWEKRSRLRGLFPTLSLDAERSLASNIDIDRGSTSEPDVFLEGPQEWDWNFSAGAAWELADLIWNDTETSIEIRERALVDQREEILSEVTRLYFEWKRLQAELNGGMGGTATEEVYKRIRCEEIHALLDGLTGGYLSQHNKNTSKTKT